MATIPLIASADDHVVEPPDLWTSRLARRWRDRCPRVERRHQGRAWRDPVTGFPREEPGGEGALVDYWHYEDAWTSIKGFLHSAGDPDLVRPTGMLFEQMRPGCYDPARRLADMDANHVEASLCFPNFPRFCGQAFNEASDRELAELCVRAYNDFMVEQWSAGSGGRLIPLCLVPLWDAGLAAAEVRRNAARGVRAVTFSEIPPWLGLPSIHSGYWDPFFQACDETGTVIFCHIGSGTKILNTSPDAPQSVSAVAIFANSCASMLDFLMSGVFARFPNLKVCYAESQIGWIPYVLERADDLYAQQGWTFTPPLADKPSDYYRDHVYSCFYRDRTGILNLDAIGADQVLFEVDYPHGDTTYPDSLKAAEEQFGDLDQETVDKIARGNLIRLLGLELPPVR
ncbi:amidohydrolase family protein [Pseudofrankia asymbiotica]|uniref:Amidohydrolase n=1 Tax=Pseudofrankia asymbiotica TaxID=1834516 RepID=A0A1V2I9S0_9ACTN|nr:amidohydrolase family protein [Pseudofrankia asymbiotica]ONH28008.1 amidohydrolase [Pseudofrankia asymbiotica]